jgi:hypothetical protein
MPGMDYKVLEAKNFEAFRERVIQEGAEGWRVISMAISPHRYFYAVLEKKTAT